MTLYSVDVVSSISVLGALATLSARTEMVELEKRLPMISKRHEKDEEGIRCISE